MISRLLALLLCACACAPASAEIGTIDNVPAATLLFPHFEVDTSSEQGVDTILTLQNASATAMLLNVTLWTDLGLPTANFNIYLTGYDAEDIALGDLFRRVLPTTGSAGQDPHDTISPQGPYSQDINFASCNGRLPNYQSGSILSRDIVGAHSGQASADYFGGLCGSRDLGDGIARGYVTVDTINQCTRANPTSPGYFADGIATRQNTMLGDYTIVHPDTGVAFTESAVHIESSFGNPITDDGVDKQTFYGRFVGFTAADHREPLPTAWAGRAAADRTTVDYWRDPGVVTAPFACGGLPAGLPSGQRQALVFTDAGAPTASPAGDLFPFASGTVAGGELGVTAPLGWLFANLNLPASAPPDALGGIRQSWLMLRQSPRGYPAGGGMTYSVPGIQLGNAAYDDSPVIP
ncbi:hypothetical protein [Chiayiivirga flava]|uniref:Uncharacterized protein n=1 Tax=Chiayiivirga flava TaxID=659595 RepID=A0A7W8G141_9GAMM|nr:hypothetical protein [Chiayiivirga flava]MBB5208448.1 hypothetical protein [Chiayiivirga flava]